MCHGCAPQVRPVRSVARQQEGGQPPALRKAPLHAARALPLSGGSRERACSDLSPVWRGGGRCGRATWRYLGALRGSVRAAAGGAARPDGTLEVQGLVVLPAPCQPSDRSYRHFLFRKLRRAGALSLRSLCFGPLGRPAPAAIAEPHGGMAWHRRSQRGETHVLSPWRLLGVPSGTARCSACPLDCRAAGARAPWPPTVLGIFAPHLPSCCPGLGTEAKNHREMIAAIEQGANKSPLRGIPTGSYVQVSDKATTAGPLSGSA